MPQKEIPVGSEQEVQGWYTVMKYGRKNEVWAQFDNNASGL